MEQSVDKYTFVNSKAAVNLVTMLKSSEYESYSNKAFSMLSRYMTAIKAIASIPHKGTRETVLKLWRTRFVNQVEASNLPLNIKTHLRCVAIAQFRRLEKASQLRGDSFSRGGSNGTV